MTAATLDPQLIEAVKGFEGFKAVAFWDYKQWTNGYGTRAAHARERITVATATERLEAELIAAQAAVDSTGVVLPYGVRKGLTDLTFNAGFGWWHAGLGLAVKQKDWATAKAHLLEYDEAGGKVEEGLLERRKVEASWFDESAPPVAVASQSSGQGQVMVPRAQTENTNASQSSQAPLGSNRGSGT